MLTLQSIDIFPWNENFNTGLPEIDHQHQKLIELLNRLASHVAFGTDLSNTNSLFDELAEYAVYHFQTEEAIWHQFLTDDALIIQHVQTHTHFIETVQALRIDQVNKTIDIVLEELLTFLTRWLASHILEGDRYLAMVVITLQSGLSLDDAKKSALEKLHGANRVLIDIILSIYSSLSSNTLQLMRELSQRKQDEESLLKLSLAVEQSPSSIVITDLNAKIEFVNEAFLQATGYTREEVIGQNPKILQSGKTPQITYQQLWKTLSKGEMWRGEFINHRKDGSEYIELALVSPICQPNSEITHYLAIKEDITERKNLERKLLEQLTFTQAVINAEIDGIAVCHAIDTPPYVCFTLWNPSMESLTGYSLAEINQLGWYQTVYQDPEIQERARLRMERMRMGEHIQGEEWTITRKNGAQRVVQIFTTQCAQDSQGVHTLAVMHDISERKQFEKALRDSHQQLDLLLNSMAEGAYGVDINGNCQIVNQSFLQILGYESADEVSGKHIHELIHHTRTDGSVYPSSECKMYAAYLRNEKIHVADEIFWRKDGTAIPVEYWSQPILHDGVLVGAIATFIDISERLQTEKRLIQSANYARSLIEASLDPLVIINSEGKITDVNSATEKVTGLDRQFLIGSDFSRYFTNPEQARIGYQQVFEQGFVTDYPLAIQHASGQITEVIYNASVFRDDTGAVLGIVATARNITERKQMEAKLIESEAHLRAIFETEPECIKIVDSKGTVLQMNPAGLEMLEADDPKQVIGNPALNAIAPEHQKAFAMMHSRVLSGEKLQLEYEIIGLKGGRRWLETHAVPMKTLNGEVVQLGVTRDITLRKQADLQLRIAATVFESQEGMMVTDENNHILRVNRAFTEITGYSAQEAFGKNPKLLKSDRHDPLFYADMWEKIKANGEWEGEIWNQRKNGERYPQYLTIKAVKDQNQIISHYVGTFTDITLKKLAAEEIERLAYYDPLTGLPNRRLLQDRLKPALLSSKRSGKRGALLFIDLDHFKTLNDTLGHDIGDLLLIQVAERLQACVRECDTVARLGGDEFVVMLENLTEDSYAAADMVEQIGNKILNTFAAPFSFGIHDYNTTPSIGITLFHGHEHSVDELLKHADIAMYQAKKSGRNALRFFEPEMQEAVVNRASIENELRVAINNHQLDLFYQVQVDALGKPIGAEALVRWIHPVKGLIPPSDFIPVAEANGMILNIGRWLVDTACALLNRWQRDPETRNLILSINISPKQFFQADFEAQIQTAIQHHSINPNQLMLELTENILIENIEEAIETMNSLRAIGVQFSIDDFGTGYSSLQYLKNYP